MGNEIFQKFVTGPRNSIPIWRDSLWLGPTYTTRHSWLLRDDGLVTTRLWPQSTVARSVINPPCWLTESVCVFSNGFCGFPCGSDTTTGTFNATR